MNKKIRHIIISFFTILILVGIVSGSFRSGMRRFSAAFSGGITSIPSNVSKQYNEVKNNFTDSKVLHKKIEELQVKLDEQTSKYFDADTLRDENERLKKILDLKNSSNMAVLAAKIIVREPLSWFRCFTISKGKGNGVEVGQPVLYNGYLIGIIKDVYHDRAVVKTVADKDCWVSCQIKDTVLHGVLKGRGGGSLFSPPECELEFIFRDAELNPGMIVETSGFGEKIPAGIPVGTLVGDDEKGSVGDVVDNIFQKAKVYPFADFKDPIFVTVIINK